VTLLLYLAIPGFIALLLVEFLATRRRADLRGYTGRDTAASLAMGIGMLGTTTLSKGTVLLVHSDLYQYRLFDLPENAWWAWPLLIVCEDFCYYWFHRAHHEVRFLWAAHVNHHSSRHYNLSTALRQSWTTFLTGPVFWLPLPLVGFSPQQVFTAMTISLIYQFWIHTETIKTLGPLEWVFNTPSHHRVHHGRNPQYLDRNHGGILILWDRLFGTFEPEKAPVDYGLTRNIETYNPVRIAFHEWAATLRDVVTARGLRARLGYFLAPPGWRPDGAGQTSKMLRREAVSQDAS
jgi:sterol desaturase/sphingolipid hydroxylase (fatty acid hydroxylase superfamily)